MLIVRCEKSAEVPLWVTQDGQTLVMNASGTGNAKMVRLLADHGADLEAKDKVCRKEALGQAGFWAGAAGVARGEGGGAAGKRRWFRGWSGWQPRSSPPRDDCRANR